MNEKMNAASNNGASARGCDRAGEMVTYLYGEAAPAEAKAFRRHLTGCAVCRDEMAAFGGVREMVGEWRAEALGTVPSLGMDESFATTHGMRPAHARERSAIAALREFFSLSPLWLRAGAVAATLVFCALAALTLARAEIRWDANGFAFNTGVEERVVERERVVQVPVETGLTQEQVNAQIAAAQVKWEEDRNRQDVVVKVAGSRQGLIPRDSNGKRAPQNIPGNSQRNRQDVARNDLNNEDFFNPNEERVPRLTDLLGAVKAPKED
jgi:anti-sigma factor RsiW